LTRSRRCRSALALSSSLALACSLLRPLDDLEMSQSSPAAADCREEMQQVRFEDGSTFCIDKHETTRAEYGAFLDASVSEPQFPMQDSELCPTAESFEPGAGGDCLSAFERGVDPDLPVVCVDLCDAMAYCEFRGKRLCGGRGGKGLDAELRNEPTENEWLAACIGGTTRQYPYGPNFERSYCNVSSAGLEPVGRAPDCSTPDDIRDLSGNVAEWTLVCRKRARRAADCLVAGGEYLTTEVGLTSCYVQALGGEQPTPPRLRQPAERGPGVGIRCCSD
jgi:formylglycine-generating enzyme required for sulfatase activity